MQRQPRTPGVRAEKRHAHGHSPIRQRCLFQVAYAVFVESDPVLAGENFVAGVGMRSIYVVHQRRCEQTWGVNGEPQQGQDGKRRPGARSNGCCHEIGVPRGMFMARTRCKPKTSLTRAG
jgi:hypothetical protein